MGTSLTAGHGSTPLEPAAGPAARWVIGPLAVTRPALGRWGANWRNSVGVANYAGPVSAVAALGRAVRAEVAPEVCSPCRRGRHDRCEEDGCACETCAAADD